MKFKIPPWGAVAVFAFAGVVVLLGAQWMELASRGWQFARAAWLSGAWWQPFSAQWVHLGWAHAVLNTGVLVLMLWLFRGWVTVPVQAWSAVGGYLGVAVVLMLDSRCDYYAGASGALHGYWAGCAWALLRSPQRGRWGGVLLAILVIKMGVQALTGASAVQVYHPAHVAGAVGGVLAVWFFTAQRPRPNSQ